jgi:hypothetical protein
MGLECVLAVTRSFFQFGIRELLAAMVGFCLLADIIRRWHRISHPPMVTDTGLEGRLSTIAGAEVLVLVFVIVVYVCLRIPTASPPK